MSSVGIPTRDLRQVLESVKQALANPSLAEKLLQLCERNEAVLASVREEQGELACQRAEYKRDLARASQEHNERIARERAEWAEEAKSRRTKLAHDEYEAARRREQAEKDEQEAAARAQRELATLQRQWERNPDELMKRMTVLIASRLEARVVGQAEQQQTAA
jgi:hypothetical protein